MSDPFHSIITDMHNSYVNPPYEYHSPVCNSIKFINKRDEVVNSISVNCNSQERQNEIPSMKTYGSKTTHPVDECFSSSLLSRLREITNRIRFRKYAKQLLDLSRIRMQKLLSPNQIKMINDNSYWKDEVTDVIQNKQLGLSKLKTISRIQSYIYKSDRSSLKQKSFLQSFLMNIPIFLPNSRFVEVWQAIKIVAVVICFFCYLICFAFGSLVSDFFYIEMVYFCQIFMFLDIFFTMNMGIYDKGVLCIDRYQILQKYKNSRLFYYDVASQFFTSSYFLITLEQQSSRIALCLLLPIVIKYNDISLMIKKIKDRFLLDKKAQNIIELINLLKNIFLISHVFACIWVLAAKVSYQIFNISQPSKVSGNSFDSYYSAETWIDLMNLQGQAWTVQYVYSYYFITVTMITVGYGDVRPTNILEVVVCTFLMMICCVIFGFTINSIGVIFQDFYSKEKSIQQKRYIIGHYMMRKGVARSTMKDIYEYLEYYWKEQSDENSLQEQHIISQLSNGLKEELLAESNRIIFKDNTIFKNNFSNDTLIRCIPFIHEQRCTPEEIIYDAEAGETDIWIYFIQQGEIELYIESSNDYSRRKLSNQHQTIYTIKQGEQYGEISFFTGEQSRMSLKSLNFTKLLKMRRQDFIQVLMEDRTEYETFCMIKDTIIYTKNAVQIKKSCISCNEYSHDIGECPRLHFQVNKGKLIGQQLHSVPHISRQKQEQRVLSQKQGTFENLEHNTARLAEYMNDCYEELIQYEENNLFSTPFSRSNSYFAPPPIDILENNNAPQQEKQEGQQNLNSNSTSNIVIPINVNLVGQDQINSPTQTQNNSNNLSTITNLMPGHSNQTNYQTSLSLKPVQLTVKKTSFKRSQSQQKLNKQHSNLSYNEDDSGGGLGSHHLIESIQQNQIENVQEHFRQKQKVQFERETSITQNQPIYFYSKSESIQSEQHIGSGNSQDKLHNAKQQGMSRQNAKDVISTLNNLAFNKSEYLQQLSNLNNERNYFITSGKQPSILPGLPSQFDNIIKRIQFNNSEFFKQEIQTEHFDLFLGKFEKLSALINYFPHFNFKNVISRIQNKLNYILPSKRGSLKADFGRNFYSQKFIRNRRSQLSSQISILSGEKYKNYQMQRKEQKNKSSAFKTVIIQRSQDKEEKEEELQTNIEDFITHQEIETSQLRMDPNTPANASFNQSDTQTPYKFIQQSQIQQQNEYDFQQSFALFSNRQQYMH